MRISRKITHSSSMHAGDTNMVAWARMTHLFDQAKQDICCKCALVRLIQYDHAISLQERIAHGLPQEHTIREEPAYHS